MGPYLPWPVALYELADGETVVSTADPVAAIADDREWQVERPDLAAIGVALESRVAAALERIRRHAKTLTA
jgi:hypothetical protein